MEIYHPVKNEDEILARARANITSPDAEKRFLRDFLNKKEAEFNRLHPDKGEQEENRFIINRARRSIEPLYQEIEQLQARAQEKFPKETIPFPVWMEEFDGETSTAIYYKSRSGVETFVVNPNYIFIPPKITAAVLAHESGHDIEDKGFMLYTNQKQRECLADHTAQYLGYGDLLKLYFEHANPDLDLADPDHRTARQRIASLSDTTFAHISPADLNSDDECNLSLKAPPPPPRKPEQRQK